MTHDLQLATTEVEFAQGNAFAADGKHEDALACFEKVRLARPADPHVHNNIGSTLVRLNRLPEAVLRYREASALEPGNAGIHHNIAWTLEKLHQLEEAVHHYRHTVRLNPAADGSYNNMANCLHALGRFEEAHEAWRHAIRIAPDNFLYYRNFVQSKRLPPDDPCFIAMKQHIEDAGSLTPENRAQLHFAYAQALADAGQDELSFGHAQQANALYRPSVRYDEAGTHDLFARIPRLMNAGLLKAKRGMGDASDAPVFVIGMPRSGSSLIEQILASHPQVFGAGEITGFSQALTTFLTHGERGAGKIGIDALPDFSANQLAGLGADYLRHLHAAVNDGGNYQRIIDKNPFNFLQLGLIHLALPRARFIHSRRAPVDTCLSIFPRIFNDVPFSYDLGELGRYYRAYDALMEHWRHALPDGVMIDVQYEDLVDDLEGTTRRMLAHCGLTWDARCLDFHQTTRQVITASAVQVREPLFRTSLARWRASPKVLQPLFEGLGPELAGTHSGPRETAS